MTIEGVLKPPNNYLHTSPPHLSRKVRLYSRHPLTYVEARIHLQHTFISAHHLGGSHPTACPNNIIVSFIVL